MKPDDTELARTLTYLSGYEDQTQPVEIPPSVLADAARLLRELRAEVERLKPAEVLLDEIAKLRAENERLKEATTAFATFRDIDSNTIKAICAQKEELRAEN